MARAARISWPFRILGFLLGITMVLTSLGMFGAFAFEWITKGSDGFPTEMIVIFLGAGAMGAAILYGCWTGVDPFADRSPPPPQPADDEGSWFDRSISGRDIAARRIEIGATLDAVAAASEIDAARIEQFERFGLAFHGGEANRIRWALWWLESEKLVSDAGLEQCEWIAEFERTNTQPNAQESEQHFSSCSLCQARVQLIEERAPEMPGILGWFAKVNRLPPPMAAAIHGVMLVMMFAWIPILSLIGAAAFRTETSPLWSALALLSISIAAGAMGGLVYFATRGMRERGPVLFYASWILVVYGIFAGVCGVIAVPALTGVPKHFVEDAPEFFAVFRGPVGTSVVLIGLAIFGIIIARSVRQSDESEDVVEEVPEEVPAEQTTPHWFFSSRTVFTALAIVMLIASRIPNREEKRRTAENYERDIPKLEARAARKPDDAEAQFDLAWSLAMSGRHDLAIPVYARVVRLDPTNAHAHNAYGWALTKVERFEEGLIHFREAVRLSPRYSAAQHNVGWALYNLGRYEESVTEYEKAISLDPGDGSLHSDFAHSLCALERYRDCLVRAQHAVAIEPNDSYVQGTLVWAREQMEGPRLE